MRENRKGYNFPREVIEAVRREANGRCQSCNEPFQPDELVVHHILPVAIARECYPNIPDFVVASIQNAMCLCRTCHKREDKLALKPEQIDFIVPKLEACQDKKPQHRSWWSHRREIRT